MAYERVKRTYSEIMLVIVIIVWNIYIYIYEVWGKFSEFLKCYKL